MIALSPAAAALYDSINAAASPDELDALSCIIWGRYGADECQYLTEAIPSRKPRRDGMSPQPIAKLHGRVASRFAPRPCRARQTGEQRTKRRERKRILGGSSAMPDTMRRHYTEGERAALCIIAFEIKRQGRCTLSIDEIGDRAGVGRTTVQNALHQARLLGHIAKRRQESHEHCPGHFRRLAGLDQARTISSAWTG